jgi:subtilisin family serine protease
MVYRWSLTKLRSARSLEFLRAEPGAEIDLLLTPYQDPTSPEATAGRLAIKLLEQLDKLQDKTRTADRLKIAYHQTAVVARLTFEELVRVVLPMSDWWNHRILGNPGTNSSRLKPSPRYNLIDAIKHANARRKLADAIYQADHLGGEARPVPADPAPIPSDALWLVRVVGLIGGYVKEQLANRTRGAREKEVESHVHSHRPELELSKEGAREVVEAAASLLGSVVPYRYINDDGLTRPPLVYAINRNRVGTESVFVSSLTVKSDAVERLFGIDCRTISWAVIDSGIDAKHYAFRKRRPVVVESSQAPQPVKGRKKAAGGGRPQDGKTEPTIREEAYVDAFEQVKDPRPRWVNHTRILATYDFTRIRELMRPGLSVSKPETLPSWLQKQVEQLKEANLGDQLKVIEDCLRNGRMIEWGLLGEILRVKHDRDTYQPPVRSHGTHVAGIIGADWRAENECPIEQGLKGLCPSINLYDLRVILPDGTTDAFTVMAALQFVRSLNTHSEIMTVHGVNLSLSIPHDVRSYACGRTPVCEEAERLVGTGVVVVAAAGNTGHKAIDAGGEASLGDRFESITITDPGNAESVITVGSTHRDKPHQYGVSYFSSRGPTGDGRVKPDLIAPGEKIRSTVPGNKMDTLDGTSQAAPHVSAAAAILMARHSELIGRPAEIKRILCESATDLGRYRFFQGHGLLDILRALQSV